MSEAQETIFEASLWPHPGPLRIGFIGGCTNDDYMKAPGIPEEHWCGKDEEVRSPEALWWYIQTHYKCIKCYLIHPGEGHLTAERLQSNDINFLLGYCSVIAHVDEFAERVWGEKGGGKRIRELFRAKSSHVWPPVEVQEMVDLKSNYLLGAQSKGILIAPTIVQPTDDGGASDPRVLAAQLLLAVKERGWKKFVAKPVPSTWTVGVKLFATSDLSRNLGPFADYLSSSLCKHSWEILVQEFMVGMQTHPETRCFFYGGLHLS